MRTIQPIPDIKELVEAALEACDLTCVPSYRYHRLRHHRLLLETRDVPCHGLSLKLAGVHSITIAGRVFDCPCSPSQLGRERALLQMRDEFAQGYQKGGEGVCRRVFC